MSNATSIYIPTRWDTTVPDVLTEAGFRVAVKSCQLADGGSGREYACTRDGATITFTEVPLPGDASYSWLLGLARPGHLAALFSAGEALIHHGALSSKTYKQRSRDA